MSSSISSNICFLIQNYGYSVYVNSTYRLNRIQSKNGHGFYTYEFVFYARLCYFLYSPLSFPLLQIKRL